MTILGIKLTHDGALALIDDGKLIFSYEMEKLSNFPRHSEFCITIKEMEGILTEFGYDLKSIDQIVIDGWGSRESDSVNLSDDKIKSIAKFKWGDKHLEITTKDLAGYGHIIKESDDILLRCKFEFKEERFAYSSYQHVAGHIASAYCTSLFSKKQEDSFVLIWDGGMPPQLFYYKYKENSVLNLGFLFPFLGNVYINFAYVFKPFSLMIYGPSIPGNAMAYTALGKVNFLILQKYRDIFRKLNETGDDTEVGIDMVAIYTHYFIKEARQVGISNEIPDADMLTTFQEFIRELLLEHLARKVEEQPALVRNLCIAGGCALNIKWNSSIRDSKLFHDVWVPPFPNDSGSAIGTACCEMLVKGSIKSLEWRVYSGPQIKFDVGKRDLQQSCAENYSFCPCNLDELADILYTYDEPVVFLNGLAELGPRALGNRSIFAPAVSANMKERLNKMKGREEYRPIAPICLENYAPEIFTPGSADPFMLFDHYVSQFWKEKIPAICHLDGTARLQTINSQENAAVFTLLTAYHRTSGIPLLCNTSSNFNGSGFFPDVQSVMKWNKANFIWNDCRLYIKKDFAHFQKIIDKYSAV